MVHELWGRAWRETMHPGEARSLKGAPRPSGRHASHQSHEENDDQHRANEA
jgi:hypothetical protein